LSHTTARVSFDFNGLFVCLILHFRKHFERGKFPSAQKYERYIDSLALMLQEIDARYINYKKHKL